ncbi:MAG TPA: YbhN family protein [Actinomycetota bacterium]|jgi:putative heme transporter|nr:YbhN family protein [Actinomycetota bacterium]
MDERDARAARKKLIWRVVQILISVVLVVAIFAYAIPKIADYRSVWQAFTNMTLLELTSLVVATVFNLFTYWWQNMASIPGLRLPQAAVNNQTTTSIADTIPGGGYIAVGVGYTMYRSWGFPTSVIALSALVTGIWNVFMKLGLPVIALAILAVQGQASGALVLASLVGVAVLAAGVVLFALVLWKKELARRIGDALGRAVSFLLRLIRRPAVEHWGEAAVRFRRQTIDLVSKRGIALTVTTIVSHLALFLVLLLAVRHVGVSESEISTAQVLGVFAFGRLVTALPLTPGGLGLVELSYIGGLILAGRAHTNVPTEVFHAQVAAAVLVFRTLTYGIQIPIGAFTYLIWRFNKSWRKPVEAELEPQAAASSSGGGSA